MNWKRKILRIDEIDCIEELYPRDKMNWQTTYRYAEALRSGAEFPSIKVTRRGKRYIMIDGWYRLEAYKANAEEYITANVYNRMLDNEIYIEAVKSNIANGRQLSMKERAQIILRLQDMRLEPVEISRLVRIPVDRLEHFVGSRMTHIITGEPVILKTTLKHLVDEPVNDDIEHKQNRLRGNTQIVLIDELIYLITEDLLYVENDEVTTKLIKLHNIIEETLDIEMIVINKYID